MAVEIVCWNSQRPQHQPLLPLPPHKRHERQPLIYFGSINSMSWRTFESCTVLHHQYAIHIFYVCVLGLFTEKHAWHTCLTYIHTGAPRTLLRLAKEQQERSAAIQQLTIAGRMGEGTTAAGQKGQVHWAQTPKAWRHRYFVFFYFIAMSLSKFYLALFYLILSWSLSLYCTLLYSIVFYRDFSLSPPPPGSHTHTHTIHSGFTWDGTKAQEVRDQARLLKVYLRMHACME